MSEPTSFFQKTIEKFGEGLGAGLGKGGIVKAIVGTLLAGGIFTGSVVKSDHDAHEAVKTDWPVQVGQHLQDLVDTNSIFRDKLAEQDRRIAELEKLLKEKSNESH